MLILVVALVAAVSGTAVNEMRITAEHGRPHVPDDGESGWAAIRNVSAGDETDLPSALEIGPGRSGAAHGGSDEPSAD